MSEILEEFADDTIQEAVLSPALSATYPDDPPTDGEIKFVLDSIIDFLEPLKLQGETLSHAGQLLRDVEDLRSKL